MTTVSPGGGRWWGTATAAGLTLTSYVLVRSEAADRIDASLARFAHRPRSARTDRIVGAVTELGSVYGLAGVTAALAVRGRPSAAIDVAGSGLVAWTTAQAIKPALARERPYQLGACDRLVSEPAGTSWPSGHAAVTAAMASVIAGASGSSAVRRTAVAAVTGIGLSRLYVGVHHVTDVLAGVGVGVVAARSWSAGRALVGRRRAVRPTRR